VAGLTDAPVEFGLIPPDHWHQPDWIDEEKATASREDMIKNNVIYGGTYNVSPSSRHGGWNVMYPLQAVYRKYKSTLLPVSVLILLKVPEYVSLQLRRKHPLSPA
jgi:Glycolipid 2-alpha-mannosyltransferase